MNRAKALASDAALYPLWIAFLILFLIWRLRVRLAAKRAEETAFTIPAGMVAWQGATRAPTDWDRRRIALCRNGACALGLDWRHHPFGHHRHQYDIIAYFPMAASDDWLELEDHNHQRRATHVGAA